MGVGAADKRGEVDEIDPGDIHDARFTKGGDFVAGARRDTEDTGRVGEEVGGAEAEEEGGESGDATAPGAGGLDPGEAAVGEEGGAGGGVAGGAGKWGVGYGLG